MGGAGKGGRGKGGQGFGALGPQENYVCATDTQHVFGVKQHGVTNLNTVRRLGVL